MTKEYMTQLLKDAASAHHDYERQLGGPDSCWESWYAGHMLAQMHNDYGTAPQNPFTR